MRAFLETADSLLFAFWFWLGLWILRPLLDLGNSQHSSMHPPAPPAPSRTFLDVLNGGLVLPLDGKRLIVIHPMAVV
jgi:hypothetical protein